MKMHQPEAHGFGRPAFLALSCIGFFATPSFAQAPAPPSTPEEANATELQGVTVTDTAIDEGSYKTEAAASPKFTAPLLDTPRSVMVVPAQVIRDTGSASLVEALRTVPGITLGAGEGGNPLGDRPFIRGFDSQASTYLDGVRDIGAQSREVFAIEQIEVIKGSNGAFGGRGSAGGTINLVSKMPKEGTSANASASYGTDDYKRVTADLNHQLSDLVAVRVNGMWHDQDVAGRDAIRQKRWGIAPSITIGMAGPTRLTVSYYHLDTDELPDSGIPYLYTAANAPAGVTETKPATDYTAISGERVHVRRGAFYGLKSRDFRKTKVDQATMRAEHEFDGGITLRNTSRYAHTNQSYIWTQPDDQQGNVYNSGQVWRRSNSRYGHTDALLNQTDLFGTFKTGGVEHSFSVGAEFAWEKAQRGAYVLATGSTITPRCTVAAFDRYNCTLAGDPNPNDPWVNYVSDSSDVQAPIVRGNREARTISKATTASAYAFDTINVSDALLVNLGLRYDDYSTTVVLPATAAGRPILKRDDQIWTYQVGATFKPAPNGSLYASYATSATPPGTFLGEGQEGNALSAAVDSDDLKVERHKSYEIGTKWDLFDGNLALTLAGFRTETKNARATVENGLVAFIGERRIQGAEFGINGNITDRWNVFGGYTYMDSEIRDAGLTITSVTDPLTGVVTSIAAPSVNTGKRFPNTPEHSFTLFSNYKVTPAITIGGGAIYNSRVYGGYSDVRQITNGQLVITRSLARYVPGYWRFDANASWTINDTVGLRLNVQNIANKRYYDRAYSAHYANQAPGRSAFVTLDVRY